MKYTIPAIVLFLFLSISCFSQNLTKEKFLKDLAYYRDTLPVKHIRLFDKIGKADFENKVAAIAGGIDTLNYETFVAALYRLNASIGDEHTRIVPAYNRYLPVKFEQFEDGIFVIAIAPPDSSYLLHKLIAINGHPLREVNRRFKEAINDQNSSYFSVHQLQLLNNPSFLKGLGILNSDEETTITLQDTNKNVHEVKLTAVGQDSLKLTTAAPYRKMVSYMDEGRNYWYEYDAARKTIYFNYTSCKEDKKRPFVQFNEELFARIRDVSPDKIILDLRFNPGGNSGILWPFIDSIKESYLNKKGHLYVLIGRQTFSSAVMNAVELKKNANAMLVGEMTSGNINHYGEVRGFTLPHTKVAINYSTRYWENWKGKKGALLPDKAIMYYSKNFINNKDEALEYIYKQDENLSVKK